MDPQQFDTLSRTLAQASSRRQAMARIGAAGLLAGLATAFGRGRSDALPAVQGETCRLDIVATVRIGPDATERMQTDVPGELRGEISFSLGSDGAIDAGRFVLGGGPEVPVVGQATGRAVNLRADLQAVQEGLTLVLVGTAEQPLNRCTGAVDGYFTGPLPGDLGDWHAMATTGENRTNAAPTPSPTPVRAVSTPTPVPRSAQPCEPGLTRCGGSCVDLGSDFTNCGACGVTCPTGPGWVCDDGSCLCAPGLALCGEGLGACVDVAVDPGNCGGCSITCAADERCELGTCLPSVPIADIPLNEPPPDGLSPCAPGLVLCGDGMGVCVDVAFDSNNCGWCGIICPAGERCEFGNCLPSVPIADIPIDEAPPDSPCLPGLVHCGNGICVDIFIDSFNCGACGITCQFPQGCQGGVCVG